MFEGKKAFGEIVVSSPGELFRKNVEEGDDISETASGMRKYGQTDEINSIGGAGAKVG